MITKVPQFNREGLSITNVYLRVGVKCPCEEKCPYFKGR